MEKKRSDKVLEAGHPAAPTVWPKKKRYEEEFGA